MYDFSSHLLSGEKILYQGKPTPGKGDKQVLVLAVVILVFLVVLALLVYSFIINSKEKIVIDFAYVIGFLTMLFFIGASGYGLVYNLFLKKERLLMTFIV